MASAPFWLVFIDTCDHGVLPRKYLTFIRCVGFMERNALKSFDVIVVKTIKYIDWHPDYATAVLYRRFVLLSRL
jgi:hypothetical protein